MKGHLVNMGSDLINGTMLSGTAISYDSMGRVLKMWECGPSICGTQYQASRAALAFAYDWNGNLTEEYDGASGQITYTRSPAGEVTYMANNSYTLPGAVGSQTLAANIQNGPNGPISYTLGSGLNVYDTYDLLGRSDGQWVCNGPAAKSCEGGTQVYGTSVGIVGSQVQQLGDTALNQQMNFKYDEFGRLTTRTVTAGAAQNFAYDYDLYGNRWAQMATAGAGPQPNFTFNAANNQIVGYAYDAAGNMTNDGAHGYFYDAEGNILQVDSGSTATYVYDALNRRIRAQTSASAYEYSYDYANRRVSQLVAQCSRLPGRLRQ